ncbi:antiviral RADAR system adenosine triphosphatase RdrA [Pseudoalteromonas luteoviolacea]|uniref:Uncharacterized protein n=1 Tax=Pseudoalteromonas luteoviolacea DSM 6061 TaxID=1365250 RepID=A0A166XXR5_9GAMM|nr:antiviral RADAR system adenosine triphosphatase RdrA [Pseudoalteromonas luteoviolacea]KZN41021.1 hypothetical protein N475_01175 [Pseudoalteromonas luteoviolacea DSM 6061]MBE0386261.1 hypothetical protein [Pseudoalteromonas luteoviolacea DSM 6061]
MAIKYILDLTKEEYRDDFVGADKSQPIKHREFWQFEAREKLVNNLNSFLNDAKQYKQARSENKNKTWLSHNAILVTGQRGTGKTVFLRNVKNMWRAAVANDGQSHESEIFFLDAIDPTMLVDNDNFANVIIAQIYSEVESKLSSSHCCNGNQKSEALKSDFYKRLKILADALGKKEEFEGCTGVDKILQYKSGINIEKYFHQFVESAIQILGCSALALPIDDVDMALERAYEVVDEVRRLLGCPYIIPVVSGDYNLYEQMTNIHFDEKAYRDSTNSPEQKEKGVEFAKELTQAYLAKVFPNHMRISLLPISYIAPSLQIITGKQQEGTEVHSYREHKQNIFSQFYPLCLNEEALHKWPNPESAREFTQFIRAITPNDVEKALNGDQTTSYELWKSFINWAEQKQSGVAYTNADSLLTLHNLNEEDAFDIMDLPSFNPKLQIQKEHLIWADRRFLSSQLNSLGEGAQWQVENRSLLEAAFSQHDTTLKSMPPLEFFHHSGAISLAEKARAMRADELEYMKGESEDKGIRTNLNTMLLDIYTYGDMYSKLGNNYLFVCLSRAFEIILYSFTQYEDENKTTHTLSKILHRRPFYSIFNMAPTKMITGDSDEGDEEDYEEELLEGKMYTANWLNKEIQDWKIENEGLFDSIGGERLIPIFSYIFNKTFTAFHVFKFENFVKQSGNSDEHLTDFAKRFEYMLINAAYTAMIDGTAIQASVAITSNLETLRSHNAFNRYDRVLSRNSKIFSDQGNYDGVAYKFIRALKNHPIFTMIQTKKGNDVVIEPRIKLGKVVSRKLLQGNTKVSAKLAKRIESFLKNSQWIDARISTVKRFMDELEIDGDLYEEANALFTEFIVPEKLDYVEMEEVRGDKVNNFVVALFRLFNE